MLIYTSPTTTIYPPAYRIQDIRPRYANLFIPISSATHQRVSSRQAARQSHLLHRRYTSIYVSAGIYRYANPLAWKTANHWGRDTFAIIPFGGPRCCFCNPISQSPPHNSDFMHSPTLVLNESLSTATYLDRYCGKNRRIVACLRPFTR